MKKQFITDVGAPAYMVIRADHYTGHRSKKHALDVAEQLQAAFPNSDFIVVKAMIDTKYNCEGTLPDRTAVNSFGEELKVLRDKSERFFSIELDPVGVDTDSDTLRVTISDGERQETAHAVYLQDAIAMARAKLQEARELITVVEGVATPPEPKIVASSLSLNKKKLSVSNLSLRKKDDD